MRAARRSSRSRSSCSPIPAEAGSPSCRSVSPTSPSRAAVRGCAGCRPGTWGGRAVCRRELGVHLLAPPGPTASPSGPAQQQVRCSAGAAPTGRGPVPSRCASRRAPRARCTSYATASTGPGRPAGRTEARRRGPVGDLHPPHSSSRSRTGPRREHDVSDHRWRRIHRRARRPRDAARGEEVVVFDDLSTGDENRVPEGVPLVVGSVLDRLVLEEVIRKHKITGVVHLAGKKQVGESVEKPMYYYHENVQGLAVLLQAVADAGIRNFLFSSSASVYGMPDVDLVTEDTPCKPLEPLRRDQAGRGVARAGRGQGARHLHRLPALLQRGGRRGPRARRHRRLQPGPDGLRALRRRPGRQDLR